MPSKKQSIFILLILLVVALTSFTWGVMTLYRKIFPYELVHYAAFAVLGSRASAPKPRISFFEEFDVKADVVMIGDSNTEGALWNEIFSEFRIANRGVGRDKTDDILKRLDSIFAVEPKKAFLMVGINDIYSGYDVGEIVENYINVIMRLQNRGIVVYIQSTLECSKSNCGKRLSKVRELNEELRKYASTNNVEYIDINNGLSSETDGLLPEYTYDGIHLNGKGYLVWSRAIRPYIEVNQSDKRSSSYIE